jgi:hypothetical protein
MLVPGSAAHADANLVVNADLEQVAGAMPLCFKAAGWGTNTYAYRLTDQSHSGTKAMSLTMTARTSGDRKLVMAESPACAPNVTPGHQYDLSVWYTTTTPDTVLTVFRHDLAAGWTYWTDLAALAVTTDWTQRTVRTPPIPPNTDQLMWGVTLYGVGTLVTDDYRMVDVTLPTPGEECSAGEACTKGVWQVMPFISPVRAVHSVVLHNGNVLLIAGSGNDPDQFAAGTFKTAVYQPATGTFVDVPTPADVFCSGHVQLPDGRVLIMSGTKGYADAAIGYQGLKDSYVFSPATNTYARVNDLTVGMWYPSATLMGNGDVISLGGLKEDSTGAVTAQYFSTAQNRWLGVNETQQTWRFWGLYPSMVLTQDGRLFYTGSHVFGNGTPGTGAALYDYASKAVVEVPGLRNKDERDQSMSLLLPPAQDQKVIIMGGGNIITNPDANPLVDIVDLKAAAPSYVPGPDLPAGKMYLSAVILPDGKVFETGGAKHNRADAVAEASVYDPAQNTFTPAAVDPVARNYHSSSFLLPDGRVMSVGSNPGDGSFEMRMSVWSPPYLFRGARPQVRTLSAQNWAYGAAPQITVDGPIVKAALIRPAAATHSSDPNQRYVDLPLTVNGNTVNLNLTTNPNLAPPGWYMLFVVGANGVPSVAKWVKVG